MFLRQIFLACAFLLLQQSSHSKGLLFHRIEKGSSIADICRRLGQQRIFAAKACVPATLSLNPFVTQVGDTNIPAGTVIQLPELKLKESPLWEIKSSYLIFTDSQQRAIASKKVSFPWWASLQLGTLFNSTDLKDSQGRAGNVSLQRAWALMGSLGYIEPQKSKHQFKYTAEDLSYSTSSSVDLTPRKAKNRAYELSGEYYWRSHLRWGWGLGSSDLVTFITQSARLLKVLNERRLFLKLLLGKDIYIKGVPAYLDLQLKVFDESVVQGFKFDYGYELLLGATSTVDLNSRTDLLINTQFKYRNDQPQTFDQSTLESYLGLGIRWAL